MLRAFFVWLSESRTLRAVAERSSIGQRTSSRFVAGTTVEDAMAATRTMNDLGLTVSIDNLVRTSPISRRRGRVRRCITSCWRRSPPAA